MIKNLMLTVVLLFSIGQTKAIIEYKDLTKKEKKDFNLLIGKTGNLEQFKKYIESEYNYKITGIYNKNIAEILLESNKVEDLTEWNSTILIYSFLNEIEEQIKSGIKMTRFKKILSKAILEIEKNGKLPQETLLKIIYKISDEKESFLKVYMTELISKLKIKTPSLITSLNWLSKELKNNICVSKKTKDRIILDDRFNNISVILKTAPYLVIDYFYNTNIEKYIEANISEDDETIITFKEDVIKLIKKTKKDIKNLRASFKLNFRSIFS